MSTRDIFHDAVRRGLEKEQWQISSDPLELRWEEVRVKIDLAAERLLAAERGEEKIAERGLQHLFSKLICLGCHQTTQSEDHRL